MSGGPSPALTIRFASVPPVAERDRLVALLADHDLVAIHEDDIAAPRMWTAHFASAAGREAAAEALASATPLPGLNVQAVDVEDDDWARRTQANLPAIRVGRVIVAPPWDLRDASAANVPGTVLVEIEPSRGFGTGHHQSTRLCLGLMQNRQLQDRTVIDVGTGSGVLAIVAAMLGAAFVSAIDADPDAIENARENIERNGVGNVVEAHVRDISEGGMPPADVVVANLTGTLLTRYAAPLGDLVRPGGSLIVAGFTIDEKDMVAEAFNARFQLSESAEEDDWWGLVLTRN